MEGSHLASSPAQQEDSWTCQRCGWVYPNVHPSAKHRRNHKKHCGKIKGFELQSEVHKGGSSDEVSSDDGSHVDKENFPLQSAQTQHRFVEAAGSVTPAVETPSVLQSGKISPPETVASNIIKSEKPLRIISDSVEVKPEVPAYETTRNIDLTNVVKSEICDAELVPNIGPRDISLTLDDRMDVKFTDLTGDSTKTSPSDILEGYVGLTPGLVGVDAAARDSPGLSSNQTDYAAQRHSTHENAAPKSAESTDSLDKSKIIEEEGRMSLVPCAGEAVKDAEKPKLHDSDQSKETQIREFTIIPVEHSISRQGSSQVEDSWTCRRCGWVYPNPHPSAKHRRNHKKHCGKLKGFEVQNELHNGGSSDEVSSDDEKKGHLQHESSPKIQGQDPASGLTTTGTATSESRDLSTSKEDLSAGGLPGGPDFKSVTTSTESSFMDTNCAVLPAEKSLIGQNQGKGAAAGDYTLIAPHESVGPEIFQKKDEISSSEVIAQETQLDTVPFSALSEHLGDSVKNTSNDSGSISKVFGAPHEVMGDSTPKVENSSVLNVGPPDAFPSAFAASSKVDEDEIGVTITPITPPRASGLANEKLKAFGGTGSHQDVHPNETTDKAEKLVLIQPSGPAGEMLDSECSSNLSLAEVAETAPDEEAESLSVEGSSVKELSLPLETSSAVDITGLANALEKENKFVNLQATIDPVKLPTIDDVSSHRIEGPDGAPFHSIEKIVQSFDNNDAVNEVDSQKRTTPADINHTPMSMTSSLESNVISKSVPLASKEDTQATSVKDEVYGQIGGLEEAPTSIMDKVIERPQAREMPMQSLDSPGESIVIPESMPLVSVQDTRAISTKDEVLGQIGGLEGLPTSSKDKVVERGQVMEIPSQSLDNPGVVVSEDATGKWLSSDDRPTSTIESKSEAIPEKGLPVLIGDNQARSTTMNMGTDFGLLSKSTIEESDFKEFRLVKDSHEDKTAEVIGPLEMLEKPDVKQNSPSDTLATNGKGGQMDGVLEDASPSSMARVTEVPVQSLDNPKVPVLDERTKTETTGESLLHDDRSLLTTTEAKSEAILEKRPPVLEGDALDTSTIVNMANDFGPSSSPKGTDSKQSYLVKDGHEDKRVDVSGLLDALEKPDKQHKAPGGGMLATSAEEEVSVLIDGRIEETYSSSVDKVVERSQVTEMSAQTLDNPDVAVSEGRTKTATTGEFLSSDNRPTSAIIDLKSEITEPPVLEGDIIQSSLLKGSHEAKTAEVSGPQEVLEKSAIKHNPANDTLITRAKDEGLDWMDRGLDETPIPSLDKGVERPQLTEMIAQSFNNPGMAVSDEITIKDTTEKLVLSDDRPTSATIESISEAIPEKGSTVLARNINQSSVLKDSHGDKTAEVSGPVEVLEKSDDKLATRAKDEELGRMYRHVDEISTSSVNKVVERPQATEFPAQPFDIAGVAISGGRTTTDATGECEGRRTSAIIESKSEAIPETGPTHIKQSILLKDCDKDITAEVSGPLEVLEKPYIEHNTPDNTLVTSTKYEVLGQIDQGQEETLTFSVDKVVERPLVSGMLAQFLDNPGVAVSEERTKADTTGELLLKGDRTTPTTIDSKSEAISERGPSVLVGDTLATRTSTDTVQDSDPSSSHKKSDIKQSALEKDIHEDETAEVSGPQESLEKPATKDNSPYETDFGSSGRSLDGTSSFTKAESEFSQRSDFAASSHKLSDSLEFFEDAPDTLEASSVGGSVVDESESLDEPQLVADGVQEDSKLSRVTSMAETVACAQESNTVNGATHELEKRPNVMHVGESSSEEKAATMPAGTSYAASSKMEELKAPSPEAWQEPGPSTLKKEGKKVMTSEVMEDENFIESHTALRSLMAKEGKDKMDQDVASPVVESDPQGSGGKEALGEQEAAVNGKKPKKSKSRSFWSHCVCCPAVH